MKTIKNPSAFSREIHRLRLRMSGLRVDSGRKAARYLEKAAAARRARGALPQEEAPRNAMGAVRSAAAALVCSMEREERRKSHRRYGDLKICDEARLPTWLCDCYVAPSQLHRFFTK